MEQGFFLRNVCLEEALCFPDILALPIFISSLRTCDIVVQYIVQVYENDMQAFKNFLAIKPANLKIRI